MLASAHVLTMDVDEEETFDAFFGADRLGSNAGYAFWHKNLEKGISLAPTTDTLSFYARKGIREDYEPDIADVQSDLKGILHKDITLHPHFEEVYEKLNLTKDGTDFDEYLGAFILSYFHVSSVRWSGGEVHFRILGTVAGNSGEAAIEDGIRYLQTSPDKWGSNINDISNNIMDLL
ncbi:hypothetical protein FGADI_11405 [Fusarium gaditjirri]|uniref:Uncharacterized protein n=1 Tax=Fusarium gaditjirri TaxID=282569 RepID=A0A8H4WQ47_9HYPO|nr:hypothetical protein FGADI_11405 [Fusarium gaditjirri]